MGRCGAARTSKSRRDEPSRPSLCVAIRCVRRIPVRRLSPGGREPPCCRCIELLAFLWEGLGQPVSDGTSRGRRPRDRPDSTAKTFNYAACTTLPAPRLSLRDASTCRLRDAFAAWIASSRHKTEHPTCLGPRPLSATPLPATPPPQSPDPSLHVATPARMHIRDVHLGAHEG